MFLFFVPKSIKQGFSHYFLMKIPNRRELQHIICLILTLWILTKNTLPNHIHFYSMVLILHYVILRVLDAFSSKRYKNLSWQLMIKLYMKNYYTILTEKKQNYSALSSEKSDEYGYLKEKKYYLLIKVEW